MAQLQNPRFHIIRDTYEAGSICEIEYSVELLSEPREIDLDIHFDCWVEIYGHGLTHDTSLGKKRFDDHIQQSRQPHLEIKRRFFIECDVLNEAIGLDELYLVVHAHASSGERLMAKTAIISEHF